MKLNNTNYVEWSEQNDKKGIMRLRWVYFKIGVDKKSQVNASILHNITHVLITLQGIREIIFIISQIIMKCLITASSGNDYEHLGIKIESIRFSKRTNVVRRSKTYSKHIVLQSNLRLKRLHGVGAFIGEKCL